MIDPFESIPNDSAPDPFELNAEMPVGILSPSSISTFLRCPEQFRREYVKGEKRAPGAWAISGTAFHNARHLALGAQRYGLEVPDELLVEMYERGWKQALDKDPDVRWDKETPETIHERGLAMTREYHGKLGKDVLPLRMEARARGFVEGVPVPIYGRIDVETEEEIVDTKTGRQLKHKLPEEWFVQGIIYCFLTGKKMRWHVVSEKPAVTTNDNLTIAPTPKVIASAERLCRQAYFGIISQLREFGPDDIWLGAGMATGACKYCSFKKRCAHIPE